jgi:hypothetical protein
MGAVMRNVLVMVVVGHEPSRACGREKLSTNALQSVLEAAGS